MLNRMAAIVIAALLASLTSVQAQPYPSQDIRFISAFPPGSGSDTVMRFIADKMRPLVPTSIIVENRPGAGGVIAAEHVVRSKPDGHTMFTHAGNTMASIKHLLKAPPFDPATAIQVAATINRQTFFIVADAKKPYTKLADLTAALQEKGEKATYGASASIGLIMGALYREHTGLKAVDVQYKSGPDALNDLVGGVIDFAVVDPVLAIAQANQGRVRILAIGSRNRLQSAPELPTFIEQGVPIEILSWFAALVPAATPKPLVNQINGLFSKVIAMEETKAFLLKFGTEPWIATPEEGQARMMKDLEIWPEYIRVAKLPQQG